MANVCKYEVTVKGKKNACYAFYGSMNVYDDKWINNEEGDSDNYEIQFEGDCKWSVDSYCDEWEGDFPAALPEDPDAAEEYAVNFLNITVKDRAKLFGVEVYCNSYDSDEYDEPQEFLHYNFKGKQHFKDGFFIIDNRLVEHIPNEGEDVITIPDGVEIIEDKVFCLECDEYEDLEEIVFPKSLKIIGEWAFGGLYIENVVIQEGLEEIRNNAFNNCTCLKSIVLPNSIKKIGEGAFKFCEELEHIKLPSNLETIEKDLFCDCEKLLSIDLPENLRRINASFMEGCQKIQEIHIPKMVTEITPGAFLTYPLWKGYTESNLKSITVDKDNKEYKDIDGVVYTKDMKTLVAVPSGYDADAFNVPDSIEIILDYAFCGNQKINNIVIPETVKKIGKSTFWSCRLKSLILPISAMSNIIEEGDIKKITFVDNGLSIDTTEFTPLCVPKECKNIVIPERIEKSLNDFLINTNEISVFWTKLESNNPIEIAYVLLYQNKKAWINWVNSYENLANDVLKSILSIISKEKKLLAQPAKRILEYAKKHIDYIDKETLQDIIAEFKAKKKTKIVEELAGYLE